MRLGLRRASTRRWAVPPRVTVLARLMEAARTEATGLEGETSLYRLSVCSGGRRKEDGTALPLQLRDEGQTRLQWWRSHRCRAHCEAEDTSEPALGFLASLQDGSNGPGQPAQADGLLPGCGCLVLVLHSSAPIHAFALSPPIKEISAHFPSSQSNVQSLSGMVAEVASIQHQLARATDDLSGRYTSRLVSYMGFI
ncbi:hypothetical protein lerEdw1_004429 [Lerista edwardsae]|nr:hypothetical protein lerEdw1_004429 [Lerista edwardsae]